MHFCIIIKSFYIFAAIYLHSDGSKLILISSSSAHDVTLVELCTTFGVTTNRFPGVLPNVLQDFLTEFECLHRRCLLGLLLHDSTHVNELLDAEGAEVTVGGVAFGLLYGLTVGQRRVWHVGALLLHRFIQGLVVNLVWLPWKRFILLSLIISFEVLVWIPLSVEALIARWDTNRLQAERGGTLLALLKAFRGYISVLWLWNVIVRVKWVDLIKILLNWFWIFCAIN